MIKTLRTSRYGFTLIELAIVLAIVGVLFAGLWRLMSGGNQQLRDQAAASSQSQLISAAKAFLASGDGGGFMTNNNTGCGGANCNPNAKFNLPIPSVAAGNAGCAASITGMTAQQAGTWCGYLPPGFSTASVNSYGQSYTIQVLRDSTAAGKAPATYSFMILTSGGDAIPDMSGGRISTMIGGDGGFVYNTNVCNATNLHFACGAYGSWSADLATYGHTYPAAGGYIASRTYYAPEQDSTNQWLARFYINNSTAYNTMKADLYMDTSGATSVQSNIYMANTSAATTGGGNINMAQGQLNMQGAAGTINMSGGTINLQNGLISGIGTNQGINLNTGGVLLDFPLNSLMSISTACSKDAGVVVAGLTANDSNCQPGQQIFGDASVAGRLNVNSLYAATFIYTASDARLKFDIHPVNKALDGVMQLQPVFFTYKAGNNKSLGVLAQDVEKVYPQLVSERPDGMKTVNYEGLIAPLIGAVQELKKENDAMRQQLAGQNLRQEKLEKQLNHTP